LKDNAPAIPDQLKPALISPGWAGNDFELNGPPEAYHYGLNGMDHIVNLLSWNGVFKEKFIADTLWKNRNQVFLLLLNEDILLNRLADIG
jgi:hypothetical protein